MDTRPMTMNNETHDLPKSSASSKKRALILSLTLVLAVAAIAGACAAVVLTLTPARKNMTTLQEAIPEDLTLQEKEKLNSMVLENNEMATIARKQRGVINSYLQSRCHSQITNESIPIAHISGTGINGLQWSDTETMLEPGRLPMNIYQTTWKCNGGHDTVAGGMNFSQDTQKLVFPTCGFYHFSSQILFQYPSRSTPANFSARYIVEIVPNCKGSQGSYRRTSYTNLERKSYHKTSSYFGDIVKMCEAGYIRILIPVQKNSCCAHGGAMDTYFSTFLVQKTSCD